MDNELSPYIRKFLQYYLRHFEYFIFLLNAIPIITIIALVCALAYVVNEPPEMPRTEIVYVVSPDGCTCVPNEDGGNNVVCKIE